MRKAILAFLAGIIVFQFMRDVPDSRLALLLIPLLPVYSWARYTRLPFYFLVGFIWALWRADLILSNELPLDFEREFSRQTLLISGMVVDIPKRNEQGVSFVFKRLGLPVLKSDRLNTEQGHQPLEYFPKRIRLAWYGEELPDIRAGSQWQFQVRLRRPGGVRNPGGFDYERFLFHQRIRATGYVYGHADNDFNRPLSLSLGLFDQLIATLHGLRHRISEQMAQQLKGSQLGGSEFVGIMQALAVGDRQAISDEQWQVFRTTGTSHLIAISGLHIGLVAGLVFFLVRGLWARLPRLPLYWPAPKVAALAALLAAAVYAALAGFSIPTQRALIMTAVVMVAMLRARQVVPANTLLLALLLVLLFDPVSVLSGGFWLSFCAVALIFYAMGHRLAATGLWWRWGRLHLIMGVGLIPPLLYLFQSVPVLSPVANFIAVPWLSFLVVPFVLLGALATLLVDGSAGLSAGLLQIADWMLIGIWPFLKFLSELDYSLWQQHQPPLWTLFPSVIGIALLLAPRGWPARGLGVVFLLPMFLVLPERPAKGELWMTLLDVGQGLSVVLRTHNHVLVYDTGPEGTGERVIVPFLRQQGVTRIDRLIVGHGDSDHRGGMLGLLTAMPVGEFLSGESGRVTDHLSEIMPDSLIWQGDIESCHAGQHWQWDNVSFKVLHPVQDTYLTGNNASCVLMIEVPAHGQYPQRKILLTGDIERGAEGLLVKQYGQRLKADVLVVPHHGSAGASSPDFVSAVSAEHVLFAVGYQNRFDFPRAVIERRYRQAGGQLWQSAKSGALGIKMGGAHGELTAPSEYREDYRRYWHRF